MARYSNDDVRWLCAQLAEAHASGEFDSDVAEGHLMRATAAEAEVARLREREAALIRAKDGDLDDLRVERDYLRAQRDAALELADQADRNWPPGSAYGPAVSTGGLRAALGVQPEPDKTPTQPEGSDDAGECRMTCPRCGHGSYDRHVGVCDRRSCGYSEADSALGRCQVMVQCHRETGHQGGHEAREAAGERVRSADVQAAAAYGSVRAWDEIDPGSVDV
jgi:ribosomal protein L37E